MFCLAYLKSFCYSIAMTNFRIIEFLTKIESEVLKIGQSVEDISVGVNCDIKKLELRVQKAEEECKNAQLYIKHLEAKLRAGGLWDDLS